MSASITPYIRRAQYYETDRMGIIHHSNYIRWMEEARIDYLRQLGLNYAWMEERGVVSPIVEVTCGYRRPVKFDDNVSVAVSVEKYTGVRLVLRYRMTNASTGELCAEGSTVSCFLNAEGRPVSLKREFPDIHTVFETEAGSQPVS